MAVECTDIGGGFFQNLDHMGIGSGKSFIHLCRRNLQTVGGTAVKAGRKTLKGSIAVCAHFANNILYDIAHAGVVRGSFE